MTAEHLFVCIDIVLIFFLRLASCQHEFNVHLIDVLLLYLVYYLIAFETLIASREFGGCMIIVKKKKGKKRDIKDFCTVVLKTINRLLYIYIYIFLYMYILEFGCFLGVFEIPFSFLSLSSTVRWLRVELYLIVCIDKV